MAVGVVTGEIPRYFSIARWGDSELTLEQVKQRLWFEKQMLCSASMVGILCFLAGIFALVVYGG